MTKLLNHDRGFWAIAFALMVVMAYSAFPTPLYGLYAARDGFGALTITAVFAAYAVGVTISLFLVGHLSDVYGRKRVLLPGLALAAVTAVSFVVWRDLPGLLVARVLNGLAVGAVTATATAWIAELHAGARPDANARRAEIVGVAANIGGIGTGALVAGVLAQWVDSPLTVPYVVGLAALLLAMAVVAATPETRSAPTPRPAYRPQRVSVPASARGEYFGAALGAAVGFAAFGLFTSLAPTFLAQSLHHPSKALAGAAAFIVFASAAVVQVALARRPRRELVANGTVVTLAGLALVVLALWLPTPSLALFLIGGVAFGAGAGSVFKGAVGTVIAVAEPARRAEALAGLFLAGYIGLAVPVVGLGVLTQHVEPRVALLIFAAVLGAALVAGLAAMLRPFSAVRPATS
ncbi:MFS transporter [Solirubrobacter soli]|uniref:MFS transporter n=1 Tax=Solirubrobacter soli TaxID=363832 RepID=UPI00042A1FE8|nr:MFS transporter [Solirubrobacter soli]